MKQLIRKRPRQRVHPARARRLPWFRCRRCGAHLARMDVRDGRTCVRLGTRGIVFRAAMICADCGAEREFISMATG